MPNPDRSRSPIVVLGLGNILMADDGIGLAALEHLQSEWFIPPDEVELIDGGTWGMNLLPIIEGTDRLLVLDAIDHGARPGALTRLVGEAVPRFLSTKLSPHQIDLREVLALAQLRDTLPPTLVAVGLQPGVIEMSTELSPPVQACLGLMIDEAARTLAEWGVECFPMAGALHA